MARTTLTKTTACGSYPTLQPAVNTLDLTLTAADTASKNQFAASGNDLIIAQNTGAGAHTVTITSVPNQKNRTGDITAYSIGAGEIAVIGPLKNLGWTQTDRNIYLEANHAEVKFGIVTLPG